jgi:acetyltransferase-like isoleucine patch superfamily enzyme
MLQNITESAPYNRIVEPVRNAVRRWTHGDVLFFSPRPPYYIVDEPTYAPARLIHHSDEDPPVRIGRYSSLNETVTFLPGGEHPIDTVTSFHFNSTMGTGEPEIGFSRGPITIGCDVWAGREVLVMSGVTVGHGAVLAARAVVNKDVEPFEIVGGTPARHIRWRFDEDTRKALLEIAWWDWPVDQVLAHQPQLTSRDLGYFIKLHAEPAADGAAACEFCHPGH